MGAGLKILIPLVALATVAVPLPAATQSVGTDARAAQVQRCGSSATAPEWRRFCRAMHELVAERTPAVLGWTVPPGGRRDIGRAPLSLIEIHPQPVATTAKIVFRDIEMSIDGVGRIIAAVDETIPPHFRTIDLELPAIFPDECPVRLGGESDLASVEIKRALVLRFSAMTRDAYRPGHCPADPDDATARPATPALFIRAVTFKQATRWLLPADTHVSLAFAASRFEGPLEIAVADTSGAPPAGRGPRGTRYVALHTSVLEGHVTIYGVSVDELTAYFNRMQSFELIEVDIADRLKINDNAIGPLRIRGLAQPRELIVDANTLSDSLYIEDVRPGAAPHSGPAPLWLVAHNKITGNLKFSVVSPRLGEDDHGTIAATLRPDFRFMGMRIDGSAYFLVHQDLIRRGLGFDLNLTHSTVASRLLVTAVGDIDSNSVIGARQSLGAIAPDRAAAACGARTGAAGARFRVDLTSTTAGALVWNLPLDGSAGARCVGWSGPSFRPSSVDTRPVTGPLLVENDTGPGMDWFAQASQISFWPQAQVNPSPEAYGFTEKYFSDRGFLFEALRMKGRKTQENLSRKWEDARKDLATGQWTALIRMTILFFLAVYYWPAEYGANPERALFLLLLVWGVAWLVYLSHSRRWRPDEWESYRQSWRAGGRRPFLSDVPGFEQRDEHPWHRLRRGLYALDSMVPLVSLGVADEYQPHMQGKSHAWPIGYLPPAQKVIGTWLGSLCLVIFLF